MAKLTEDVAQERFGAIRWTAAGVGFKCHFWVASGVGATKQFARVGVSSKFAEVGRFNQVCTHLAPRIGVSKKMHPVNPPVLVYLFSETTFS